MNVEEKIHMQDIRTVYCTILFSHNILTLLNLIFLNFLKNYYIKFLKLFLK